MEAHPTMSKCPHCNKRLAFVITVHKPDDPPAISRPPPDEQPQSLDDALADDAERLHVTMGEGVVLYAMKEYIAGADGKMIWRRIDNIMKLFGGKWISQGKESHWEVPAR